MISIALTSRIVFFLYDYRGSDFRTDYSKLGVLCAIFPDVPVLAMTATANQQDRNGIKESLGLKKCKYIIGNPDRKNIFYEKCFRHGQGVESIKGILNPIVINLLEDKINYPLTVIYIPLKRRGFAYKLFESVLGSTQYFPEGSSKIPENRLFAQFHASQTKQMKEQILQQLCSTATTVRVIFATVAMGMCRRTIYTQCNPYWSTVQRQGILPGDWESRKGWQTCKGHFAL